MDVAGFSYRRPFALSSLSSYRQVIDLADFGNSWSMHTTGQSGQPFSQHYSDMIDPWQRVDYHPMFYTEDALHNANADALTLNP